MEGMRRHVGCHEAKDDGLKKVRRDVLHDPPFSLVGFLNWMPMAAGTESRPFVVLLIACVTCCVINAYSGPT
jgi:hypothetical protein